MGQIGEVQNNALKILHNHPQRTTLWRMRYPQHCFLGTKLKVEAEYSPEMVDAIFCIDGVMWDCLREKNDTPLSYEVQIFAQGLDERRILEMLFYLCHNNDQQVYLEHVIPAPDPEIHTFRWMNDNSEIIIKLIGNGK